MKILLFFKMMILEIFKTLSSEFEKDYGSKYSDYGNMIAKYKYK